MYFLFIEIISNHCNWGVFTVYSQALKKFSCSEFVCVDQFFLICRTIWNNDWVRGILFIFYNEIVRGARKVCINCLDSEKVRYKFPFPSLFSKLYIPHTFFYFPTSLFPCPTFSLSYLSPFLHIFLFPYLPTSLPTFQFSPPIPFFCCYSSSFTLLFSTFPSPFLPFILPRFFPFSCPFSFLFSFPVSLPSPPLVSLISYLPPPQVDGGKNFIHPCLIIL